MTNHGMDRHVDARPGSRGVSVEWAALWVILVLAFALSFRALFDVGRAAGLGSLSWALPVIVDGFAVLAARVIEHLESKWARLYPWALLIGLVGVSSWWNALHAGGEVVLDPNVAAVVAGAPPVILGLAYHLLRMVTAQQSGPGHAQPGAPQRAVTDDRAQDVPGQARTIGPVGVQPGGSSALNGNGDGRSRHATVKDRAWEWYCVRREAGHEPSAPELAHAVNTSPGNARKLIAEFKRRWNRDRPGAPQAVTRV